MQDRNCKKLKPLYHLKKQPLNNIYFYFNPCRPSYTANIDDGELENGFVPSWVKDDPRYREYNTCKCRYSFNCPSSGLKFVRNMEKWPISLKLYNYMLINISNHFFNQGSCSKDKKYCCFNSRKYPALVSGRYGQGQHPSYPVPFYRYWHLPILLLILL